MSYSETPYIVVSAYGEEFDRFDVAVADDQTVSDVALITEFSNRWIYKIDLSDEVVVLTPRMGDLRIAIIAVTSGESGWVFRLQVPDRDTLTAFQKYCIDEEISFHIHQLVESTTRLSNQEVGVTEAQRESLITAYQEG